MHEKQSSHSVASLEGAGTDWNPSEVAGRARKITRILIKRAAEVGQIHIARYAGVSDSTVSAWFQKNADAMGKALAYMGFKVVPQEMKCYDPDYIDSIFKLAKVGMETPPQELEWEKGV